MWTFRKIEMSDAYQVSLYREAMLVSKSSMDGCNGLAMQTNMTKYITLCKQNEQGLDLKKHLVPCTQFGAFNHQGQLVGMCNVRHQLNDLWLNVGGHIGYSVHPNFRRQGIATFMLQEALKYCRYLHLKKVLLTCLEDNEASKKTILKCGGVYEDTRYFNQERVERYWINCE